MVKVYQSAYTYLPFAYLLTAVSVYGSAFHSGHGAPFVLLTFALINTAVHHYVLGSSLVRGILHRHVWRAVTTSFFGVLLNNTHDLVFRDYHSRSETVNVILSAAYLGAVWAVTYGLRRDDLLIYLHLAMFYLPIRRTWEINLHLFALYLSVSIVMLFARVSQRAMLDPAVYMRPVLRIFVYVRICNPLVLLGPLQLYYEFVSMQWREIEAMYLVRDMISADIRRVDEEIGGAGADRDDLMRGKQVQEARAGSPALEVHVEPPGTGPDAPAPACTT